MEYVDPLSYGVVYGVVLSQIYKAKAFAQSRRGHLALTWTGISKFEEWRQTRFTATTTRINSRSFHGQEATDRAIYGVWSTTQPIAYPKFWVLVLRRDPYILHSTAKLSPFHVRRFNFFRLGYLWAKVNTYISEKETENFAIRYGPRYIGSVPDSAAIGTGKLVLRVWLEPAESGSCIFLNIVRMNKSLEKTTIE